MKETCIAGSLGVFLFFLTYSSSLLLLLLASAQRQRSEWYMIALDKPSKVSFSITSVLIINVISV